METRRYAYYYGVIGDTTNGRCTGVDDTTNYILNPVFVPIPEYNGNYLFKYYWPLPETVTSHDDFQGKWYTDAAHQNEWIPT